MFKRSELKTTSFKKSLLKTIVCSISFLVVFTTPSYANSTHKVKTTDNLSTIINKYYKDSHLNKFQLMIGILAENPHAFSGGNINALKSNQVLSLPDSDNLKVMDEKQASKLISKHHKHFRGKAKKPMAAPFEAYSSNAVDVNALIRAQQNKIIKLKELKSEQAELLARVEQLIADKEQMDTELQQLDSEVNK